MKIILLRDVKNIGRKYEVKEVNDGFARNGLIGKGAALPATAENLSRLKKEMDKMAKAVKTREELLSSGLEKVAAVQLHLKGKANTEGHLFAAIHAETIALELEKQIGIKIDPAAIFPKSLKTLGEHSVEVKIGNKRSSFKIQVDNN